MCQHRSVWEVAPNLSGTQGRNSAALSTEILIIHLFKKAKQPNERTDKTQAGARAAVVAVHEAERIMKDLFILMTGIQ